MNKVRDRFLQYIAMDTQSDERSRSCPSTPGQKKLACALVEELTLLGAQDANADKNGYVTATIPGNAEAPVIGFIAHLDTSPDVSGKGVHARCVRGYDGGDIVLSAEDGRVLSPSRFPDLRAYVGQDLIVTDGTTLLGADDKAGVAEIMTMAETLLTDPTIRHGTIRIGFTPDEEIGRGANLFDVAGFCAQYAYTVDGGALGELEYENFNAANARVSVRGINIHPGSARGQMKNAILIAMEFNAMLPALEVPAATDGYEGFYHLDEIEGSVENTQLRYIVRDHDRDRFEKRKELLLETAAFLNAKYGEGTVEAVVRDSYYNMKERILPHFHLIETARRAMEELGIEPVIVPIRGGTDGARLSYQGLPCPNLFTGGHHFHGRYEYIPVQSMEKAVQVLVRIAELYARGGEQ